MIVGDIFWWIIIGLFMISAFSGVAWLTLFFVGALCDQWKETIATLREKKR